VPGDEVNHATLAEVAERHLRPNLPPVTLEVIGHHFRHSRVAFGEESKQLAAAPADIDADFDLERLANLPDGRKREAADLATFDQRTRRGRDARSSREIHLPPTKAQPHPSERAPKCKVFHAVIFGDGAYLRLTAASSAPHRRLCDA
jgi:hypothetical protein